MVKIDIMTKGMHCSGCEMLIKDTIQEIVGIIKVDALHRRGIVAVEFDEEMTKEFKIKQAIISAGYKVK